MLIKYKLKIFKNVKEDGQDTVFFLPFPYGRFNVFPPLPFSSRSVSSPYGRLNYSLRSFHFPCVRFFSATFFL